MNVDLNGIKSGTANGTKRPFSKRVCYGTSLTTDVGSYYTTRLRSVNVDEVYYENISCVNTTLITFVESCKDEKKKV